jgi:hypothetical protein
VGLKELERIFRWIWSVELIRFLKTASNIRFYTIAVLLFSFVFLNISRIDFFLCSVLFLEVFISMFYFDDDTLLKKMFLFYMAGTVFFIAYFSLNVPAIIGSDYPFLNDLLALAFIVSYCVYTWVLIRDIHALRKKYKITLILSVVTPFLIGPIFKYILLVPLPTEGLIVAVMDAIRYFQY